MRRITLLMAVAAATAALTVSCQGKKNLPTEEIEVTAFQFTASKHMTALKNADTVLVFKIKDSETAAFNQSAVRQQETQADKAPTAEVPYFNVEMALPTPPAYVSRFGKDRELGPLAGLDEGVFYHNHSAGLETLPNGDLLAVYFSTPAGLAEADPATTFIQSRLRFGSLEWDLPEVFFATAGYNDQSALLWRQDDKLWFFGGGRKISDYVPFRIAVSEDNGAHWTFSVPQLDSAATDYTAQPVSNGFADPQGNIYMVCDAKGSQSFLWKSNDGGIHWQDQGGRTGGRHSTIVPLDDQGNLLSFGGKNASVEGWSPLNTSSDWGKTWSQSIASPFPPLGTAQRPSMIRLASGHLLLVSDAYIHKYHKDPPAGWAYGNEPFVAISKDNGQSWRIKTIPYGLPHNNPTRLTYTSLGYVTLRQSDNGMIHVLTTANANNLHYEFNEAWVWSDEETVWAPMVALEGGELKQYTEYYTDAKGKATKQIKSTWSARIMPDGRYLLDGEMKDYYPDGSLQHEVTYNYGRKTGCENFWNQQGNLFWHWDRDLSANTGVWTRYWPNGIKKSESTWNLLPTARDRDRQYIGYVANGPARHWDEQGQLVAEYTFENGSLGFAPNAGVIEIK